MAMTKEEFAKRWDSDISGGFITYDDCADCAIAWGIYEQPRTTRIDTVIARVVEASGAKDKYVI